ncbi:major facilitator superfamily domain-containing protein 6-like [Oratosquilla oratoria]|uniref:major facilitator superfamily domain-containing protein 6-like n=1 Tax=Oratosquilla oratoria TaxID=337810 RepID=UPI003F75DA68
MEEGGTPCGRRSCQGRLRPFFNDLFNVQLAWVKTCVFFVMFGVVMIWPQLPLHQQSLNLTVEDVSFVSGGYFLITLMSPFFAGFVGDKIGNFKVFMSLITALAGAFTFLFLAIPAVVQVPSAAGENITSTIGAAADDISVNSSFADEDSLNATTLVNDPQSHAVTFYSYMAVRLIYGKKKSLDAFTKGQYSNHGVLHRLHYPQSVKIYKIALTHRFLQTSSYVLMDSTVLVYKTELGINYGFQRIWGTIAVVFSSIVGGYLVQDGQDFRPLFIASGVVQLIAAVLMLNMRNLDTRPPATRLTSDLWSVVRKHETLVFFLFMICIGVFFGFTETFLYIYLKSMGASNFLVSMTVAVGAPLEVILQVISSYVVGVIGYVPTLCICNIGHVVRYAGFRFMTDPMMVLPLEVADSITNGLLGTASVMYCGELALSSTVASLRGLLGATSSGIGRTIGAVAGNQLREYFGPRESWGVLAVAALVLSLFYAIYYVALVLYRIHYHSSISISDHYSTNIVNTGNLKSGAAFEGTATHRLKSTTTSKGMVNQGFEE